MKKKKLVHYNDFLLKHIDLTAKRIIKPIYRGDSLRNLCNKLNVEYNSEETNIETILDRLFMVGEKAKRFYTIEETFEIDDSSDYVFEKINKYFSDSLKSNNKSTLAFFNRNKSLKSFFSDKKQKRNFLRILEDANEKERIIIRNFYLTLLHQLAAINYKSKSHFVSTSEDYLIAEKFSSHKGELDRIILHCWRPIKEEKAVIKKFNLPSYSLGPYDYQKEFSVLGGILPHFISGLEITRSNEFFPNPNIFSNQITDEIFISGLEINQINFENIFNLTNYKRSLVTNGLDIWEKERVNK